VRKPPAGRVRIGDLHLRELVPGERIELPTNGLQNS
jgi:hypothetical protein